MVFVTGLFSAIYISKDCTRKSSAMHIRKMVEFLIPNGELSYKENSSQLGRIIAHLSDDIYCEMSYAPIRTHIVINRFLHSLMHVILNDVNPRT